MRIYWLPILVLGLLFSACANLQTAPTPEETRALAPTGKLRIAFLSYNPIHATNDLKAGIAIDLGNELARRLGVPLEVMTYPTPVALFKSVSSGEWDIIFSGVAADQAKTIDYSPPYAQIEMGYLVAKDAPPIAAISEIDKPGVRIAVVEHAVADALLTPMLKQATLVRVPTIVACVEAMKTGKANAFAAFKNFLYPASEEISGSRVLEGGISVQNFAIGVPKGNAVGAAYVRKFVEEAKAAGLVSAAIERARVRGLNAAP